MTRQRRPPDTFFINDTTHPRTRPDNPMKIEPFLAELNRLRNDIGQDPTDIEWLTLHHAFCFLSYKMADFQAYLDEAESRGEFDQFKQAEDNDD